MKDIIQLNNHYYIQEKNPITFIMRNNSFFKSPEEILHQASN